MKVTLLSPYHGGSHRAWAEGLRASSRNDVEIVSLPAQFWKWRMHGGAIRLADSFLGGSSLSDTARPDLLLATDMLDLTTFLSLTRQVTSEIPAVLYMHENQLTYPLPEDGSTGPMRRQLGERDRHYAFVNFSSMMAADRVCFNSSYHRNELFASLPGFLNHYPDEKDAAWIERIEAKSGVLPLGIDLARLDRPTDPVDLPGEGPLILWNQRWEYDKRPELFFEAILRVAETGRPFRLAVCGENFRQLPEEFLEIRERLSPHVSHWGFADEDRYRAILGEAALVFSTADHDFFGISVCEAMYAGAFATLPGRLNYPSLVPVELHEACLYDGADDLHDRICWAIDHPEDSASIGTELRESVAVYDWSVMAPRYDAFFEEVVAGNRSPRRRLDR